jgi:ribosome-interacting GTPase 1
LPANLTAEAKAKWSKAQQARTPKEKMLALEEFLSAIPKHKGNERLRAQTKRKIALLRAEVQTRKRGKGGRSSEHGIRKAGAAQITIIGMTNVGRSSLLSAVTSATPTIAAYPYTTKDPVPGMLQFEDLQFQLVEVPALVPSEGGEFVFQEGCADLVRNSDGVILMVDLSTDPLGQLGQLSAVLGRSQISATKPESNVSIVKTQTGGVQLQVSGRLADCTADDVRALLKSYGVSNALIRASGDVSLDAIENLILDTTLTFKPTIVVANKEDMPNARTNVREFVQRSRYKMPVLVASCLMRSGLSELGATLFRSLELARVYTKEPSALAPSPDPFVIKTGTTVGDLSRQIHSALFRRFKYARVWGESVSYAGERVGLSHILLDGDTVEIHA